jgi:MFS family permease
MVRLVRGQSFRGRAQEVEAQKRAEAEEESKQPQDDSAPNMSRTRKLKLFFGALKPAYWQALIVIGLQSLGWFDTTFHTLRAAAVMSKARLPLITTASSLVQACLATTFGAQAKRSCRRRNTVLLIGMAALIAANAVFALVASEAGMLLGALLLGLHLSMTDAVSQAMLSSYIPAGRVRGLGHIGGTAWSFTNLVLGLSLAYGNRVAGKLADVTAARNLGNIGCFGGGMIATGLAAVALMVFAKFFDLGKDELVEKRKSA